MMRKVSGDDSETSIALTSRFIIDYKYFSGHTSLNSELLTSNVVNNMAKWIR